MLFSSQDSFIAINLNWGHDHQTYTIIKSHTCMRNIHVCHVGTIFIDRDGISVLSMVFCAWGFAGLIVQHEHFE